MKKTNNFYGNYHHSRPEPGGGAVRKERTRPPIVQRSSGQSLNLPPVAQCPRRKERHHSRALAEAEIQRLKLFGLDQPERGELHAYECSICSAFHVGHKSR